MRAVTIEQPGEPQVMQVTEVADPQPGPDEVVIAVDTAGVNRADLLQRAGKYDPPPGASDILGLECSGTVVAVGDEVTDWRRGDECCALLAGGGYAEKVAVPAGQVMPVPSGLDLAQAAALPEVAATVWSTLVMHGHLQPGETLLVHGGTSGIGTFAIQLAVALGCPVWATAGSDAKVERINAFGGIGINYRDAAFADVVAEATGGRGLDVILDLRGADYFADNLRSIASGGRLTIIATQGGRKTELDIGTLMNKRASVIGTTLRPRAAADKARICAQVVEHVWPLVADGKIKPVVHDTFQLDDAARAHEVLHAGDHIGKVLLRIASNP